MNQNTQPQNNDSMNLDDFDTDREVGGVVYRMFKTYGIDHEAKAKAQTEAYFNRINGNYSRAMRVLGGHFKGHWACYVSRCYRGA